MPDRLQLQTTDGGESPVVTVVGELDLTTTDLLAVEVRGLFGSGGGGVVLDLTGLAFVDSTGLSTLVSLRQEAEEAGVALTLANVPGPTLRLMSITRIDTIFGLAGTAD